MVKVIQLTPSMSRGQIHLVLGKYNVGEDDFAHVVAHLDSLEALAAEQARAEVLAAACAAMCVRCEKGIPVRLDKQRYWIHTGTLPRCDAHPIRKLQPAAKDLEALLEEAHAAGAIIAGEQLLKSLTEGGEFAVGSPLAKVKQRVEELLRRAEIKSWLEGHISSCQSCQSKPLWCKVAKNKEAQLAELEPMKCGHPKACLVRGHFFSAMRPCNKPYDVYVCEICGQNMHKHTDGGGTAWIMDEYCSACAEREKARAILEGK